MFSHILSFLDFLELHIYIILHGNSGDTWALLHKKIVGIKAKSKSKIRIKPNLESNLNRVA